MNRKFLGTRILSGLLSAAMVFTMAPQSALSSFAAEQPVLFEEGVEEESAVFATEETEVSTVDTVDALAAGDEEADEFETAYTATVDFLYVGGNKTTGTEDGVNTKTHAFVFDPARPMYVFDGSKTYGAVGDGEGWGYRYPDEDGGKYYSYRLKDSADFEKDYTFTVMPQDDDYQLASDPANIVAVYYQATESATFNDATLIEKTTEEIKDSEGYVIADSAKGDYVAGDVKADGSRDITITKAFVDAAKKAHEEAGEKKGRNGVLKVIVLKDAGIPKECEAVFTGDVRTDTTNLKKTIVKGTPIINVEEFSTRKQDKSGMHVSSVEITLNGDTTAVDDEYYSYDAKSGKLDLSETLESAALAAKGMTIKLNAEKKFTISGNKEDYVTYNFELAGSEGLPGDWHAPAGEDYQFTISPKNTLRRVVSVEATIAGIDEPVVLMKDDKVADLKDKNLALNGTINKETGVVTWTDPKGTEVAGVTKKGGLYTCTIPSEFVTGNMTIAIETVEQYEVTPAGVEVTKASGQTALPLKGEVKTETEFSFIVLPVNGFNAVEVEYTQTKADNKPATPVKIDEETNKGYVYTVPATAVTGPLAIEATAAEAPVSGKNNLNVYVGGRGSIATLQQWNVFDGSVKGDGTPNNDDIKGESADKAVATNTVSGGNVKGTGGYPFYFHVNTGHNNKITKVTYQVAGKTYPDLKAGLNPATDWYTRFDPATPVLDKDGKNNGVYMIDWTEMKDDITIWTDESVIDWITFTNSTNDKVNVSVNGAAVTTATKEVDKGEPMSIVVTGANKNVKVTKVQYKYKTVSSGDAYAKTVDMGPGGVFTVPVSEMEDWTAVKLLVESEELADPDTYRMAFAGDTTASTVYGYPAATLADQDNGLYTNTRWETKDGKFWTAYKTAEEVAAFKKMSAADKCNKLRLAVTEESKVKATVTLKGASSAYPTANLDKDASTWTASKNKAVVEVTKDTTNAYEANIKGVKVDDFDDVTFTWKDMHNKSGDDNIMTFVGTLPMHITDLFAIEPATSPASIKKNDPAELKATVANVATGRTITLTETKDIKTAGKSDLDWTIGDANTQSVRLYAEITKPNGDELTGNEGNATGTADVKVSENNKLSKGDKIKIDLTANRYGEKGEVVVNSKTVEKELTVVTKTADDFYVVPTVTIVRGGEYFNEASIYDYQLELAEGGLTSARVAFDVYEILDRVKFKCSTGDGKATKKDIEEAETFEYIQKVTPESYDYKAYGTSSTAATHIGISGSGNEITVSALTAGEDDYVKATIVADGVELSTSLDFDVEKTLPKQNVQIVLSDLDQWYSFKDKDDNDLELVIPVALKDAYIDKVVGDGDGTISKGYDKNEDRLFSLVEAEAYKSSKGQTGGVVYHYEVSDTYGYYLKARKNDVNEDSLVGYRFLNQTTGAKLGLPTEDDLVIADDFKNAWEPRRMLVGFYDKGNDKLYKPGEQIDITANMAGSDEKTSNLYAIWAPRYVMDGIYRGEAPEDLDALDDKLEKPPVTTYKGASFQVAPGLVKTSINDKYDTDNTSFYKYELATADSVTWAAVDSGKQTGITTLDATKLATGNISVIGELGFTLFPTATVESLTYDLGKDDKGNANGVKYEVSTKGPSYELDLDALPDELEAGQEIDEVNNLPIAVGIKQFIDNEDQTSKGKTSDVLAASGKLEWSSTSDLIKVKMNATKNHENEAMLTVGSVSADTDVTLKLVYTDPNGFTAEATKTIKVKKAAVEVKFYTDETAATETTFFTASIGSDPKGTFYVKAVTDTATNGTWSLVVADPAEQFKKKAATIEFEGGALPSSKFKSVGSAGVREVTVNPKAYVFNNDPASDVLLGNTVLIAKYTVGKVTYTGAIAMSTYLPIVLETQNGNNYYIVDDAIETNLAKVTSKEVAVMFDDTDISIVDENTKHVTAEIPIFADGVDEKTQKVAQDLSHYKVTYSGDDPVQFRGFVKAQNDPEVVERYVGKAEANMKLYASYGPESITSINPSTRVIKLDNTTKVTGTDKLPIVAINATVEPAEVKTDVRIAPENGEFFKMAKKADYNNTGNPDTKIAPVSGTHDLPATAVATIQGIDMDQDYDKTKNIRTDTVYVQAIPEKAGKTVLHLISMDDAAVENTITLSVSGFNKDKEGNETYFKPDGEQAKGEVITIDGIDHYYDLETGFRVTDGKCVLKEGTVLLKGNIKQTGLIEITEDNGDKNTYWVDPATGLVTGGVIADVKDGTGAVTARYVIDKDGKVMVPEKIAAGETYAILTAVDGKTYLADKDGKILTKAEFDKNQAGVVTVGGEEYVVEDGDVCAPAKAYYYDSYKDVTWKFNAGAPTVDVTLVYKADDGATKEDVRTSVPATSTDGAEVTMKTYKAIIEAKYPIKGQTTKAKIELTKMYDKDGNSKEYKLKGKVKFDWAKTIEEGATKPVVKATVTYSVTEEGKSLADETFKDQPAIVDDGVLSKDEKTKEFTASYTTLDNQTATEKKSYNVNKGKIEPESTDPADTSEAEGLTYNLFYENEGIEVKLGDLTVDTTAFASTSPKASQYYEIVEPSNETTGSFTVKVKATGTDRAKAASAANSKIMVPTADGGVFEYSLPVAYKKPQLKKSVASGKINKNVSDPQKVTVTLSELKTTGAYEKIDLSEQQENVALYSGNGFTASDENISVDGGTLSITTTSKVTGGKIHVQLEGWTAPVDVAFNITAVAKNVITVDKAKVYMNTNKKALTSQTVTVLVNGEEPTEAQGLTMDNPKNYDEKKSGFTAKLEGGTVTVSYPEDTANMKAGTYNFKLKTSDGGQGKISVVVSKKELAKAVTLKTNIKYNVVTKQAMVITPTLSAVTGEIEEVTTNDGDVFTAEYNAEKNQIVLTPSDEDKEKTISYKTQYNPTLNFKMADGEEFAIKTLKFKPVKTLPTVKIDRIKVVKNKPANGTSRVTSYYLQKGKKIAIAPAKVEIIGNKVAAVSGEENKWQHSDSGAIFTVEQDEDGKILVKMTGPVADDGTVGALTKKPSGVKVQTTYAAGADTVVRKTALNVTLSAK